MKKLAFALGVILSFSITLVGQTRPEVKNLRTEYLHNPIGIDVKTPRFSWELAATERGAKQTAYEITITSDKAGSTPVWTSGKVVSDKSVNNLYAGTALAPSTRYYWHVDVWDNNSTKISSTQTAFFETGLLDSGWGAAKWIKATTLKQGETATATTFTDYTISMDFQLNDIAAGPCFAAKDGSNFFMWQINIETGRTRFRPHSWLNGGAICHENKDITSLVDIKKGVTYTLRIEVKGDKASTYINNILIDADRVNPRGGNYGYGNLGFRSAQAETSTTIESASYDNIKVTTMDAGTEKTLFEENFSNASALPFTQGSVVGGRLLVNTNSISWQRPAPAKFTLETDMTLLNQNAGILFAAKDAANMYMWSINTKDQTYPLIRRHIFTANNPVTSEVSIGAFYSKADLIGKERHVKIDVDNNVIKTYIDGVLVDTYNDVSATLKNGFVGFRAYNGDNSTDEIALYDNVVLTNYVPNASTGALEPVVAFSENFESGTNPFEDADTVTVAGNVKLKMIAKASDLRVLQGVSTGIPMFRTKFNLDADVLSAKIYTSALGVYDLFINGNRVGTPTEDGKVLYDELKPGWTEYNKSVQYSTYDVTTLLQSGANVIGAHVASGWWNGVIAHGQYGNQELSFIAKLVIQYTDGSTKTIVTDPTWLTASTGPVRMADIYNGETYDARKESGWKTVEFDDSNWLQTAAFTGFSGKIKAFVGPTIQVRPELNIQPVSITVYDGSKANGQTYGAINTSNVINGNGTVQLKKGQTAIYDFGQNMAGWAKFTAKSASGTKIKIRFGEMLNDNGALSRGNDGPAGSLYTANFRTAKATINYTFKGAEGGETFNPNLTFFGFRYCEVSASDDVEIQSMIAEVVGSATEEGSTFKSSSALVNKLYSNVIWGQRSNFLSVTTDCPQRDERLGWTGDTQIFSKAAAYNADVASFFHKWMGDMRDSQRSDGAFPSTAPIVWGGFGQGAWAEAGIIVPWNVYLMYDDAGIIAENYAAMEKYMAFLAAQAGSGYLYNGAGTDFGDWVAYEAMDKRYISVCYYAYSAQLMSKMSKALSQVSGDTYDVKSTNYANLYTKIKAEFQTRFVNADGTLKQTSQTAYLLALKLDLFPNDVAKNNGITFLTQKIATNGNKLSTGFIGTGILNQTLSQFGATGTAYNLLLQRGNPSWLYSIDQGATTIWERWDSYTIENGFHEVSMNSFNHYSYGAVSEWMYRFMGGIEADESTPGFKHFILQPNPDNRTTLPQGQERISSVDANFKSYYGSIKSAWVTRADGNLSYTATVPANTTATLYLPLSDAADVVYEGSVPAQNAEGVTFVKKENGKAVYELKSGTYSFGLNVPTSTGIKQVPAKKKGFKIFPNPVHSKLTIAAEPTDYEISDLTSKMIQSGKATVVNVSGLLAGVYFIRVGDDVSKFLKN
ncbi:MAG: family 78 glycoside hydrolase catalytic domain [Paludibacter sp.]|nr:family 78 glycoside hydrolase catalytic domain [Paludibacter sp.]